MACSFVHNSRVARFASLSLLLTLAGCDADMLTEQGQVRFEPAFGGWPDFINGSRVFAGTQWCPVWAELPTLGDNGSDDPELIDRVQACFDITIEGASAAATEGCVLVPEGEVVYEMQRVACEEASVDDSWVYDRFVVRGVGGTDARGTWWSTLGSAFDTTQGAVVGEFPEDARRLGDAAEILVFAEREQGLLPTLSDAAGPIAWELATTTVTSAGAEAEYDADAAGLTFSLAEGEVLQVEVDLDGELRSLPAVRGVALVGDESLSVHQGPDDLPTLGLALVRRAQGEVIYGVPFEVAVDAPYLVEGLDLDNPYHGGLFELSDACFERGAEPIAHEVEVSVSISGTTVTRTFAWESPAADADYRWEPPVECEVTVAQPAQGCACTTQNSGTGTPVWLVLLLGLRRRRVGTRAKLENDKADTCV